MRLIGLVVVITLNLLLAPLPVDAQRQAVALNRSGKSKSSRKAKS
jgi:hypothetical protein